MTGGLEVAACIPTSSSNPVAKRKVSRSVGWRSVRAPTLRSHQEGPVMPQPRLSRHCKNCVRQSHATLPVEQRMEAVATATSDYLRTRHRSLTRHEGFAPFRVRYRKPETACRAQGHSHFLWKRFPHTCRINDAARACALLSALTGTFGAIRRHCSPGKVRMLCAYARASSSSMASIQGHSAF